MRVSCQAFWLQKAGLEADEYEDAFAPRAQFEDDVGIFRCAVADGATETSFAALWAQLLVDGYSTGDLELAARQASWRQHVGGLKLSWYAQEKAQSGAFAALVGLTLGAPPAGHHQPGSWQCWAVGDSCLFHVRNKEILQSIPLSNWQQFNSSPALLSSDAERNKELEGKIVAVNGTWNSGDVFYLMTDAISSWFLRRQEELGDALTILSAVGDQESFSALVDRQRQLTDSQGRHLMRNDDVTLMHVRPLAGVTTTQS